MNKCEMCGKEHDGSYGSGRFCSKHCRFAYSGKIGAEKLRIEGKLDDIMANARQNKAKNPLPGGNCQYCNKYCTTHNSLINHEKRCPQNPKRLPIFKIGSLKARGYVAWNKGLTKETSDIVKRIAEKESATMKGRPGHPHTEEFKQKQRENALRNKLGGFHMRRGIMYNGIKLDSSYEVAVAIELDKHNVKWSRCSHFPYHINGKIHYYTPDFYLPEYDVYLDPKNDFLIENVNPRLGYKDVDKIKQVEIENNIRVIILNKSQLTWDYISTVV